jgi:UDP-GlcNAc:undecaprenyl-phosphate GlcNAc-1-phosphate transferase
MTQHIELLLAAAFFSAAMVTCFVTPAVIALARRAGALDHPRGRRLHAQATPLWGGLAMMIGWGVALAFALRAGMRLGLVHDLSGIHVTGIVIGCVLIGLVGAADDRFDLRPLPKMVGQIAAAAVALAFGVRITGLFGHPLALWTGGVLTVIWIVAVVNVINFVDGLDGLAAGVSAIAALTFAGMAAWRGQTGAAVFAICIGGACLGFLPYNFNPARVFMGDLGSHFLGYAIAAVAIVGTFKIAATAALLSALLVLGLPIGDTLLVVLRRYRNGQPISHGDRQHLHYRLLDSGLSQRQAVLVLYAVSMMFSLLAVLLSRFA